MATRYPNNRTGLTGLWDIELEYAREGRNPRTAGPDVTPTGDVAPSIFTAIQEQRGLKVERRRETMDVLVIEHVEMPTPN